MKINEAGVKLIKSFESCKLKAYKADPSEKYYTIGWGHYGADVSKDEKWTQKQADEQFEKDIVKYENYVKKYVKINLNENQFSALVSFCYNCGAGNLKNLVEGRTAEQIAEIMPKYNKCGGKVLTGLTRRRKAEVKLFNTRVVKKYKYKVTASVLKIRKGAGTKYDEIGQVYKNGAVVEVIKFNSSKTWGLTNKGWVSMAYLKKI